MSSKVAIINVGLRRLGQEPITSLIEGSRAANLASPHYDELLPAMLRSAQWNWATQRVQLAQSATVPAFEFDHQYYLPADWLRTVVVSSSDYGETDVAYKIAYDATDGEVILSDASQLYLTYIAHITSPAFMPADFQRALSMALARDLAIPLTSSQGMYDRLAQEADQIWTKAVSIDAIEDMPDRRPLGSWVTSRNGAYVGGIR